MIARIELGSKNILDIRCRTILDVTKRQTKATIENSTPRILNASSRWVWPGQEMDGHDAAGYRQDSQDRQATPVFFPPRVTTHSIITQAERKAGFRARLSPRGSNSCTVWPRPVDLRSGELGV